MHRYGGNSQLAAGADDAASYLSAVGNEDLLEHGGPSRWEQATSLGMALRVANPKLLRRSIQEY
jgi:hypothetical protein